MSFRTPLVVALGFSALTACSGESKENEEDYAYAIPQEAQSSGDPVAGKDTLLNGNYMSCGIPWKFWSDPNIGPVVQGAFGYGLPGTVEGRTGDNATIPYSLNVFTAADGAKVVNANCLGCHGGRFDGEVVVGLGNPAADFTTPPGGNTPLNFDDATLAALGLDAAETANMKKMMRMVSVLAPALTTNAKGLNPAEQLTGILIAHHERDTLAWSDTPLIEINYPKDENGTPMTDAKLTSDPPPWWRAHKKHALFYNAMARGEHRGTMALATAVCVDNLAEAQRVDDLFKNMQAFIGTVRPPAYKRNIDTTLADAGKQVFLDTCSRCHGTYAPVATDDANDTYPNLLIRLDYVGTDPAVADAPLLNPEGVEWYNGSFYGSITRAAPSDPFPGYVPPPLDGIWATAPYLHNGSVPNIALLLNSRERPKYWKRTDNTGDGIPDYDDANFDEVNMGWPYEEVSYGQADAPADEKLYIYDTTNYSQGNGGHTFGDALTDAERRSVIEYLKTL